MGIIRVGTIRALATISAVSAMVMTGIAAIGGDAAAEYRAIEFRDSCSGIPGRLGNGTGEYRFTLKHGEYRFTLKHGDVGGCSVDKKARHSAPYWERSEIRSTDFAKGKTYRFEAEVKFDPTTTSSNRTTFFQVHQYKQQSCPSCVPAVMLKANGNGSIIAAILKPNGHHHVTDLGVRRGQIAGRWAKFSIVLDTNDGSRPVSVLLDGRTLYSGNAHIDPRGSIFTRFGLYRPGSTSASLPTDRVSVRNPRYGVE